MATVLTPVVVVVNGSPLVLLPGHPVPEGVKITAPGVLNIAESGPELVRFREGEAIRPRGNASRHAWAAYAEAVGVDPGDMTRNQIKEVLDGVRDR